MQIGKNDHDKAARAHVEGAVTAHDTIERWPTMMNTLAGHKAGAPLYMYGIRAPEDDDLPVARQQATDVPEDIRRIARMCITTDDIADAILAERKRCAGIARSHNRWDEEWDGLCIDDAVSRNVTEKCIAEAIESGQ